MDMLIEEDEMAGRMMWATRSFRDDDVEMAMRDPSCAVISDTAALSPEGKLGEQLYSLSGYGWAPRFLQYYVRDRKVLDLSEGIRRITSLPASRVGIKDRGLIEKGMHADLVVFDAQEIASRFTIKKPRQHPVGIVHVAVNGAFAMRDGKRTSSNTGKVLRSTGTH
jgi:N-acyl-D-aspartate/D-glutamate deacylase